MNKFITVLSFSSRNNGNCANISQYLSNYYKQANVKSFVVDSESVPPCGKCDCECLKPGEACPQRSEKYSDIMDTICQSDLVYFIVPNYCGFPCANYFAFNERSVGYFGTDRDKMEQYMNVPKRFIIVSNTEGFEDAMRQQTNAEPDILYLKSRKYGKRSIMGDIMDSNDAQADLDAFLKSDDL